MPQNPAQTIHNSILAISASLPRTYVRGDLVCSSLYHVSKFNLKLPKAHNMSVFDVDLEQILRSLENYGDLAGSEALTRALICERNGEREKALYWAKIYAEVIQREAQLNTI